MKVEMLYDLMESRGWSEVNLARKLDLNYSYIYRVMRDERGIGKKFIANFMKFCDKEGLDFKSFITLHD